MNKVEISVCNFKLNFSPNANESTYDTFIEKSFLKFLVCLCLVHGLYSQ